jgi:preprotein translocase subunit SecD
VERAWSFGRRAALLAACLGGAGLAALALHLPERDEGPPVPPAKLEVVRVDDLSDPLADVPDTALPEGSGIEIFYENAPAGIARYQKVHYARIALRTGESKRSAAERLRAFLATVRAPKGARFGLAEVAEVDPDTDKESVVGLRSYLLVGEPILETRDVVDAAVALDDMNDPSRPYVTVTLSDDAAARFEEATRAWVQRRIAIVLDDEIDSAPVVKTAISGGRISITMGMGDPERLLDQAKRLARGLRR